LLESDVNDALAWRGTVRELERRQGKGRSVFLNSKMSCGGKKGGR